MYDLDNPYCTECGKPCGVHEEEIGIGGYDYMGETGHDISYGLFSDCCGEEVEEEKEK